MSMRVSTETGVTFNPVFLSILEDIQGGVTIATTELPTNIYRLPRGTLLSTTATSKVYQPVKTGKSTSTQAAATKIYLTQGVSPLLFKVGEFIARVGGTTGSTITAIATSTNTVGITTSHAIGALTTSSQVMEVAAAGATLKKYTASAILKDTVTVREDDGTTLNNVFGSAVVRGSVRQSALPYSIEAADKTGLTALLRFE